MLPYDETQYRLELARHSGSLGEHTPFRVLEFSLVRPRFSLMHHIELGINWRITTILLFIKIITLLSIKIIPLINLITHVEC